MSRIGEEWVSAAHREVVDAGRGVLRRDVQGQPAGRLQLGPVADRRDHLAQQRRASCCRRAGTSAPASTASTASADRGHLDLHRHVRERRPDPPVRRRDAARGQLVVVLDHRDVVEAHALVGAAAGPDRVLLQRPQARRGLAGVEHGRLGAGQRVGPGAGCAWPRRTSGRAG